jgi:ABC-type glycerol-3-phosphate transport system substrate-binding protein
LRKTLITVFLFLLTASLCAAVTIEVWEYGMANEFVAIIQELADLEFTPKTGIEVNLVANPYEGMQNKVLLAMVSGDPPDVLSGAADHIVEYGIRGGVIPMRKVFPGRFEAVEAKLYSGVALDHNGNGFGLVESVGSVIGYQRLDIFANLGLEYPETWDEMYTMLPKLRANGHEIAWGYGGPASGPQWGALTFMKQHGGGFVDPVEYRSLLNDPGTIAGFKEYVELYTIHKMPKEINYFNMFRSGELAAFFDTVTAYAAIDRGAPELSGRWSYGLIPGTVREDGYIDHQAFMGTGGIAIAKDSKHKEEAFQYIEWYLSDEVQIKIMEELPKRMPGAMWITGNIAGTYAISIRDHDRSILAAQLSCSTPFHYYPGAMSINRYVEFAVHEVLQLGKTPEEALLNAHNITEQELRTKLKEYERFIKNLL